MRSTTFAIVAALTLAGSAGAQTVTLAARPDSKLSIEGTSNLHAWECKASSIDATIEMNANYKTDAFAKALQRVTVKVPVGSLKCGHGAMDKNLYKALKAEQAPMINYILASFDAVPGSTKDDLTVKTVGNLSVAGAQKTVNISVAAHRLADGSITAKGEVPILMTDYGIKPPTAMLGALKTGNEVKVKFELLVAPTTAVAEKP